MPKSCSIDADSIAEGRECVGGDLDQFDICPSRFAPLRDLMRRARGEFSLYEEGLPWLNFRQCPTGDILLS
jgi:hypothetical protein